MVVREWLLVPQAADWPIGHRLPRGSIQASGMAGTISSVVVGNSLHSRNMLITQRLAVQILFLGLTVGSERIPVDFGEVILRSGLAALVGCFIILSTPLLSTGRRPSLLYTLNASQLLRMY